MLEKQVVFCLILALPLWLPVAFQCIIEWLIESCMWAVRNKERNFRVLGAVSAYVEDYLSNLSRIFNVLQILTMWFRWLLEFYNVKGKSYGFVKTFGLD